MPAGRPTKLTPEVQERIALLLKAGAGRGAAAAQARITHQTLLRWLARGEKTTRGRYCEFLSAVREAEALPRVRAYASLVAAFEKDWRAAHAFLKGRDPEWREKIGLEHSGQDGAAIPIQLLSSVPRPQRRLMGGAN